MHGHDVLDNGGGPRVTSSGPRGPRRWTDGGAATPSPSRSTSRWAGWSASMTYVSTGRADGSRNGARAARLAEREAAVAAPCRSTPPGPSRRRWCRRRRACWWPLPHRRESEVDLGDAEPLAGSIRSRVTAPRVRVRVTGAAGGVHRVAAWARNVALHQRSTSASSGTAFSMWTAGPCSAPGDHLTGVGVDQPGRVSSPPGPGWGCRGLQGEADLADEGDMGVDLGAVSKLFRPDDRIDGALERLPDPVLPLTAL